MREIAKKTVENGHIEEHYRVLEAPNGDIALECSVPGTDVLKADTFSIPAELRSWLSAAVQSGVVAKPAHFETGIEFAARAIRIFAQRAKTDTPHVSAQAALHLIADILDGGSSAMCQPVLTKVIPIRGFVEGERVFLSGIDVSGRVQGLTP